MRFHFIGALILSTTFAAHAAEEIKTRKLINVGCHNFDGICYVALEGTNFGASLGCSRGAGNQFRFENGDTDMGRRTFATMLSALLGGRPMTITVDGCTSQGYPKLSYFQVE